MPQIFKFTGEQIIAIEKNVKGGIRRLKRFETPQKGLSYWPGGNEVSEWGTNYAFHFLTLSRQLGYSVNENFYRGILRYMKNNLSANNLTQNQEAYRLYVLSINKEISIGHLNSFMNRYEEELNVLPEIYIALAYLNMGQKSIAEKMYKKINIDKVSSKWYRDEPLSFYLKLSSRLGYKNSSTRIMNKIVDALNSEQYLSTYRTSNMLVAASDYIKRSFSGGMNFEYSLNGQEVKQVNEKSALYHEKFKAIKGTNTLNFKNKNSERMFLNIIKTGKPKVGESMEIKPSVFSHFKVSFFDENGKKIARKDIKLGMEVKILIEAGLTEKSKKSKIENVAISIPLPSAMEIIPRKNESFSKADYVDVRDDRVDFFMSLEKEKVTKFEIFTHVAFSGKYFIPNFVLEGCTIILLTT